MRGLRSFGGSSRCCPIKIGNLRHPIWIERRETLPAAPGECNPRLGYTTIINTRVQMETFDSVRNYQAVDTGDERATHRMTMRFTNTPIDIEHRVRDNQGYIYKILATENVNEDNEIIRLYCLRTGSEERQAAN